MRNDEQERLPEGWKRPPFSERFHYFRNGESLCGKYKIETMAVRGVSGLKMQPGER